MDEIVLLVLVAVLWGIGTPIMAIVALVKIGGIRIENARLAAEIATLRRRIEEGTAVAAAPPSEPVPAAEPAPEPTPTPAPQPTPTPAPEPTPTPTPEPTPTPAPEPTPTPTPEPGPAPPPP